MFIRWEREKREEGGLNETFKTGERIVSRSGNGLGFETTNVSVRAFINNKYVNTTFHNHVIRKTHRCYQRAQPLYQYSISYTISSSVRHYARVGWNVILLARRMGSCWGRTGLRLVGFMSWIRGRRKWNILRRRWDGGVLIGAGGLF